MFLLRNEGPYCNRFEDIYFSAKDGLGESRYVFLNANHLPARFVSEDVFTLVELGFGTGLNFMVTLHSWLNSGCKGFLNYVAIEKYPLNHLQITQSLVRWKHIFGQCLQDFLNAYPSFQKGVHRLCLRPNIALTLIFDDVSHAMSEIQPGVNCWYLDGFNPSKNPAMWSNVVYESMCRLSQKDATFSTFTAAGFVKRGLQNNGFLVSKLKGYGHKREMLTGVLKPNQSSCTAKKKPGKKIAIIGSGPAGVFLFHRFSQAGFDAHIYETRAQKNTKAQPPGPPGDVAIVSPRIHRNKIKQVWYDSAFSYLRQLFRLSMPSSFWAQSGSVHLAAHSFQCQFFRYFFAEHSLMSQLMTAAQLQDLGLSGKHPGIFLRDTFSVQWKGLRQHLLQSSCQYDANISEVRSLQGAHVLLDSHGHIVDEVEGVFWANCFFPACFGLSENAVAAGKSGQISNIKNIASALPFHLIYKGYLSASFKKTQSLGVTYERFVDASNSSAQKHAAYWSQLQKADPRIAAPYVDAPYAIREGIRWTMPDGRPVYGELIGRPGCYLSSAHGAYGILSAAYVAEILFSSYVGLAPPGAEGILNQGALSRFE